MLSLDFADTAIIEIIATARIMAAIVPNSGITWVPIISIVSAPAGNAMVIFLSVDDMISSKLTSSPSIKMKKSSSSPLFVASNTDLGTVRVSEPSFVASIDMMKVEFGNSGAYEKAEKEVFQAMHQKQVDAGAKGSWGLLRFMSPVGSETYASHITVNMFKDYSHLFGENMAYDGPTLTEEQIKTVEEGISTRDMKYVYTAKLIKMAR